MGAGAGVLRGSRRTIEVYRRYERHGPLIIITATRIPTSSDEEEEIASSEVTIDYDYEIEDDDNANWTAMSTDSE